MDGFTRKHAAQLASAGIPEKLHGELRRKLEDEVFDAGDNFFIALVDIADSDSDEEMSTETARPNTGTPAAPRKVVVRDDYVHDGGEEIFLVDHAWTFQAGSARQHLASSQPLLERMAALMQLPPASAAEEATAAVTGGDHLTGVAETGDVEETADGGREGREAETVGVCGGEEGGVLEGVLSALPTFSRRYGLGSAGRYACFVNDELGSALRHSESPNCQMAPFLFSGPGGVMAFSVLWPLRRLLPSEEATVDLLWSTAWAGASAAARGCFVRGLGLPQSDLPNRLPEDCQSVSLPRNRLAKRQRLLDAWAVENRARKAVTAPPAPAPAATASSGNAAPAASQQTPDSGETNRSVVPEVDAPLPMPPGGPRSPHLGVAPAASAASAKVVRDSESPLTVWTDLPYLCDGVAGLTRAEFRVLESGASPRVADVLWASRSIDRSFEAAMGGLLPEQLVNQFPYEAALVIKSHLARTIQREFGSGSPEGDVMQPTFDLQSEDDALAFIAEHRRRRHGGLDNIWIVKPIGLARSMDTTVTGALAGVLRAADTGPKVAQLYISRPLLWKGRKFDLRIVALLVSSQPLELYVHNCYWPRVAERPHETKREESLEDPRVSLTATHLVGETAVGEACHPHYEDFARDMQGVISERHPESTWEGVLVKTRSMIASVFQAAARQQPGMASPRARAMYGCDVMVTEDLEPRLLEVTFSPANLAASPAWPVQQPEFLNEAFGCLFLGEQKNVTRLS